MNILFVHQNFPAQYRHVAPELVRRGHRVCALHLREHSEPLEGVEQIRYRLMAEPNRQYAGFDAKRLRGQSCAQALMTLMQNGFVPDVICAHPAWGEAMFLKDVCPSAKVLIFHEFFYHAQGFDVGFDPEFANENPVEVAMRLRENNVHLLSAFDAADAMVTPTRFQASTLPNYLKDKVFVVHDGINTSSLTPQFPAINLEFDGARLSEDVPIVTFINRNFEPYRGYHCFMRSLPELLAANPDVHVVLVGGDSVSYGASAPEGTTWKTVFFQEVADRIDLKRVHFLKPLPYAQLMGLIARSTVHVYLTVPFVLSWSLLEAMSLGAAIVASDTAPVREVLTHEHHALLVSFFSPSQLAQSVTRLLSDAALRARLGAAARAVCVENYDLHGHCLPLHIDLIERLGEQHLLDGQNGCAVNARV